VQAACWAKHKAESKLHLAAVSGKAHLAFFSPAVDKMIRFFTALNHLYQKSPLP
jgi:hypothetical protein